MGAVLSRKKVTQDLGDPNQSGQKVGHVIGQRVGQQGCQNLNIVGNCPQLDKECVMDEIENHEGNGLGLGDIKGIIHKCAMRQTMEEGVMEEKIREERIREEIAREEKVREEIARVERAKAEGLPIEKILREEALLKAEQEAGLDEATLIPRVEDTFKAQGNREDFCNYIGGNDNVMVIVVFILVILAILYYLGYFNN